MKLTLDVKLPAEYHNLNYGQDVMIMEKLQRTLQSAIDCSIAPCQTIFDRFRQSWKILGEGSIKKVLVIHKAFHGETMNKTTAQMYIARMLNDGDLTRVERGVYNYTGIPTVNNMKG